MPKKIIIWGALLWFSRSAIAQVTPPVTYDYLSRLPVPVGQTMPFDKPFTLIVTRFPNSNVKRVFLYEVRYRNGKRVLVKIPIPAGFQIDSAALASAPRIGARQLTAMEAYLKARPNELSPDAKIAVQAKPVSVRQLKKMEKSDRRNYWEKDAAQLKDSVSKDSVFIYIPALRPSKYFDIELVTGLNAANLATVMELNKDVLKKDPQSWGRSYQQLVAATQEVNYADRTPPVNINIGFFSNYQAIFTQLKWDSLYGKLLDSLIAPADVWLSLSQLHDISAVMGRSAVIFDRMYLANKMVVDSSAADILRGLLPYNYLSSTAKSDYYDFPGRANNLDSSRAYVDSLVAYLQKMLYLSWGDSDLLKQPLAIARHFSSVLAAREKTIKAAYAALLASIDASGLFKQSYMFGSDFQAADLKTRSSFCMTTDLGFTNIFAHDYRNQLDYIPKLFFGVNIYFRQVDKNAPLRDLKKRFFESGLLSSRNVWQYLSLSLGLTIGGMPNSNFSNLYNTFSLTAGPSFRFSRAFRLTAGLAFLDRTRANPLESSKQFITGGFVAFSVDVDFLTPIQNVTNLLFK